jgi:peptidoglycan-N-acetylglucosamine deacetylase
VRNKFSVAIDPIQSAKAAEPAINWTRARGAASAAQTAVRYAYFVNWDDNSFASLKQHYRDIDVVMPLWLHLKDAAGGLAHDDLQKEHSVLNWLYDTVGTFGTAGYDSNLPENGLNFWPRFISTPLSVMPVIDNYDDDGDRWRGRVADTLLSSPAARLRFVNNLSAYVETSHLAGLVLDFEELSDNQKRDYVALINELAERLHASHKRLLVTISPDDEDIVDVKTLAGTEADHLILTDFDEHTDNPGPLAGQGWFEAVLDSKFANVDGSRIIVGIGSYAEDWVGSRPGNDMSVTEAWSRLHDSRATLDFDDRSLNPTFAYTTTEDGALHQVWFLDGVTAYNQEAAALAMNPYGIALWRLGSEDPTVWSFFSRDGAPDSNVLKTIEHPIPGSSIIYRGSGEVLRVTSEMKPGRRTIEFNKADNLITNESMTVYPQPASVTRWGARHDRLLALTFDDGPSADFTPRILDILAQKHVKATFFLIGQNAALNPDVVRRIYREGHDIGNHTFTHPNVGLLPARQVAIELTATQRVLEAELGIRTTMWRPPFTEDMEPTSADDATSLVESAKLGYTTIGLNVDPDDWARPGVAAIMRRVLSGVETGKGNVILLHDAGGDREETVQALPQLIDQLRAKGYRFVSMHELLGRTRNDVMPLMPANQGLIAAVDDIGFSMWREAVMLLHIFFITGITLGGLRLLLILIAALLQAKRATGRDQADWYPKHFAVLVPAFNEEAVICKSIQALLDSKLINFEIIVIDDGSTDRTAEVVRAAFSSNRRVKIISKPNGGKASALNYGLNQTRAEIVITQDSDTMFEPDAIPLLLRHFQDPAVGAVAGAALVGNKVSWITQFQALEYVTSQNLDRRAMEVVNAIPVAPGAIGAWRRAALNSIGRFSDDTLAEDADATISLERAGWRVLYEPRAIARTEAPERLSSFLKQRFRWMFGMLQAAYKHRDVYKQPGALGIKLCTLPNIFLFQFIFPLISPAIDLVLLWSILAIAWVQIMHQSNEIPPNTMNIIIYWAAFQVFEITVAMVAFALDRRGGWWHLLPLIVIQRFCYRQLLYLAAIQSTAAAIRGRFVGWGKLLRTGSVTVTEPTVAGAGDTDGRKRAA